MYTILGYLWQYVTHPKAIIALSLFVALISSYRVLPAPVFMALLAVYVFGLVAYGVYWLIRRWKNAKQGEILAEAIQQNIESEHGKQRNKEELNQLQSQIRESIQLIRKTSLGDKKGNATLYELPWYMVIGNPAAGKSSAIHHSGLNFPFEDSHKKMKVGSLSGTRHCDWFFSTEGILLDTAGRYSVYAEDHSEWLGFLGLLKKNRSRIPVNGLILVVSIAELISQSPEKSLKLAKNLRARIQELTERLEIFAPVYLVFTKMDLVAGFTEFFGCYDAAEFDQVWGATLPYNPDAADKASELFEQQYNILYDGLKGVSTTHLSRRNSHSISPGVMTFPLEFKTLKPVLKTFIGTLFEENPFQFKPVFRGFYFTSALQDGVIKSPVTEQMSKEFHLLQSDGSDQMQSEIPHAQHHGYFLKDLFSEVILKDKNLVRQHINPQLKKKRFMGFMLSLLCVAILLGIWLWSYRNNQQLIHDVEADLNQVAVLQQQKPSLGQQLDALLILQERMQQLDEFKQNTPLKLSMGMYQGTELRQKLKTEYFNGIQQLLLIPVQQNMALYLHRVKANEAVLKQNHVSVQIQQTSSRTAQSLLPSDTSPQDAYNSLKAYLMLSNAEYREAGHLGDQLSRFWRPWLDQHQEQMPRDEMIQKAEKVLTYTVSLSDDQEFPVLESSTQLVDQSRQVLLSVIQGMPARDRVYNEIKMRAAVRFPALSTAQIVGDAHKSVVLGAYALPGIFTQQAWDSYVSSAIKKAASEPVNTRDWVLNSMRSDDLSFSGSPEQIEKQLIQLYKQEYIAEWKKFLAGIHYAKGADFEQQSRITDLLAEAQNSPVRLLMERVARETSWDNPLVQAELAEPEKGFVAWFRHKLLGQNKEQLRQKAMTQAQGEISQQFQMFYQLVRKRDDLQNKSLLDEYLQNFAQVRSRIHDIKSTGDIGPAAITLVKQTINDQTSVFNVTEKTVSEKLSAGLNPAEQQILQKLLVSPLIQAFESLILPAQGEINKLWQMQAYQPFMKTVGQKYPFQSSASIQATSGEIAQIFGESGSISRFTSEVLEPFVIRRGYSLSSRTWKDQGILLNPQFVIGFQDYVAPVNGVATGELSQRSAVAAVSQSNFQFFPLVNPQLLSYTVDIDGQRMVFENGVQQWVNFIWPNAGAIPGIRITAVSLDGQTHTVFEAPGEYGINKLIDSAQRKAVNGSFEMSWSSAQNPEIAVRMNFRLISGNTSSAVGAGRGYSGLQLVEQVVMNKGIRIVQALPTPTSTSRENVATQTSEKPVRQGSIP